MTRERTTRGRRPSSSRAGGQGAPRDDGPLTIFGVNAVLGLLRSEEPVTRLYLGGGSRAAEVVAAARTRGIVAETADRERLVQLAGSPHHQGVVALAPPFRYAGLDALLRPECRSVLVLDGVQDPRNLGAILRTARAAGVGGVVLPTDRCVGVTAVVASAAAGLLFGLRIARVPNLVRAMGQLKEAGFWLVGLAPQGGQTLFDFSPSPRLGLVVGGEGEGLRELVQRTCDFSVSIPMAPGVESLNAAVATGVALYDLLVRRTPL